MMEQREYIKKWIEGSLTEEEQETFENSEDYKALQKILTATGAFRAPEYDTELELARLQTKKSGMSKSVSGNWLKPLLQIAAVIALFITGYIYFTYNASTKVETTAAEKKELYLPDSSFVILNANSRVAYNKKHWERERNVELNGEAFFQVTKGSKFNVHTSSGTISVLGTEFNVNNRKNYFEVVCYTGLVKVESQQKELELHPGQLFSIIDGKTTTRKFAHGGSPSWTQGESTFESVPFKYVINELERQYNVSVTINDVDLSQHFTGGFVHSDLSLALKSITYPLNLEYQIKENNEIRLSGDRR